MTTRPVQGIAETRATALPTVLAGALLGVLVLALFGRIMSFGISRDEMLYVPPAALLGQMSLYKDFFYNHAPYSAWLFRGVYLLTGQEYLLFSARLAVFLGWLLFLGSMIWLVGRIAGSWFLGLFCALVMLANETLLSGAGLYGSNNFLPLPFAFLGLGLFVISVLEDRPRPFVLLMAGMSLSVAVGLKVSAVAFIPAVALGAFLLPAALPFGQRLVWVVLPLAVGGVLGALPLIGVFLADPALFLAHVVKFHTGPHVAYWAANAASEPGLAIGVKGKVALAYEVWLSGSAMILAFIAAFFACLQTRRHAPGTAQIGGPAVVVLAAVVMSAVMSFVPTPGFPQYYVPPVICLPLLCALLYRGLGSQVLASASAALLAGAVLVIILGAPRLAQGLGAWRSLSDATVFSTDRAGSTLRALLTEHGVQDEKVATLMPVYPVEAGLPVYNEFATGQFAYRIMPYAGPDLRAQYRAVGPDQVAGFLAADPPGSLLLGFEPELEAPFLQFARDRGYLRIDETGIEDRYGKAVLYVRQK